MAVKNYPKIASFKSVEEFREHLEKENIPLAIDDTILSGKDSPLSAPIECYGKRIGNRWCILPMEGWDCLPNGAPSPLTRRRWLNFAKSGAKLLFGCEACAVMESGKSNTRQLMITEETMPAIKELCGEMRQKHAERFGSSDDLMIGLQLTHSGRYSHPHNDARLESVTAYSHPLLDERFHNDRNNVVTDEEIPGIIAHFAKAAHLAKEAGFDFVDVKMAHGYLGHEFLSAYTRSGRYGGSFENRTRFFREIVEAIHTEVPGFPIGVRLSLFDCIPFEKGGDKVGIPMERGEVKAGAYPYAFGGDGTGLGYDLKETIRFLELAESLGVRLIGSTACSPYYNPHFQRPAYFPVSDGYLPPEEPIRGAARQMEAVAKIKEYFGSRLLIISSGMTCLQEFLPHAGQKMVRDGKADFVGIGRMVIAYPDICADTLEKGSIDPRRICRTFGDCTTAPRSGLFSGCYPLDPFYKEMMPECEKLKEVKKALASVK
ncbi:MAG: NADH:flavin oxidoreductase [Lentisphaeria bacterium]|nr:NADH:flavin oxidoreductase [Lentisphaeria bacterium]